MSCSRVELTILLIDLDDRSVRCTDEKRPSPLLINDRAVGREAGSLKPPLDRLQRLVGDKVQPDSGASQSIGSNRCVVNAKLTAGRSQFDPMSRSRPCL